MADIQYDDTLSQSPAAVPAPPSPPPLAPPNPLPPVEEVPPLVQVAEAPPVQVAEAPAAKPDALASKYESTVIDFIQERSTRTRANVYSAKDGNPDTTAKALDLSKTTGVPVDVIERDPQAVAGQALLKKYESAVARSAGLGRWLQDDPVNARIASDDMEKLANLDTAIRKYKAMNTPSESADWEATAYPQPGGLLFNPMSTGARTDLPRAEMMTGFEQTAQGVVTLDYLTSIRRLQEIDAFERGEKPKVGASNASALSPELRLMTPEQRAELKQQLDAKVIRLGAQIKQSKDYVAELPVTPAVQAFKEASDAIVLQDVIDRVLSIAGRAGSPTGGDSAMAPSSSPGAVQLRNFISTLSSNLGELTRYGTLTNLPNVAIGGVGLALGGAPGAAIAGAISDFPSRVEDVVADKVRNVLATSDVAINLEDPQAVTRFLRDNPQLLKDAFVSAGAGSASIALTEGLVAKIARPLRAGTGIARNVGVAAGNLVQEIAGEVAGETVARAVAGQEASVFESAMEGVGAAGQAAVTTAVKTVQEGGEARTEATQKAAVKQAGETITAATELLGDLQKRIAETGAVTLDDMVEKAGASKLATRSPDKLEEFMATVAPDQNVFVPAEAVRTLFQSMPPEDAAALVQSLGIADQLQEALASNGDVVIPLSKYVVESTRSKIHEAWRDDVRMQADGFSKRQADEDARVREARLADFVARAEAQIKAGIAEVDATTRVYEDFLAKAKTGGRFIDDAAKQYAALEAQRYATRAARNPDAFSDAWDAYSKAGLGTGVDVRSQLSERVGAYPPDRLDVLLDSIRTGKVAPTATDADANAQFARDREEMTAALQGIGVDTAKMSNAQIRAAIKAEVGKRAAGRTFEQSVYHGGPHIFERFSLDKIGTGEGAQAYGWGLYFAGNKAIAEHYRRNLAGTAGALADVGFNADGTPNRVGWVAQSIDAGVSDENIREGLKILVRKQKWTPEQIEKTIADGRRLYQEVMKKGRLYQVEIPDDGAYLHWDKPLGEQSPEVLAKLKAAGFDVSERRGGTGEGPFGKAEFAAVTGREFYLALADKLWFGGVSKTEAPKAASLALREAGIPGIQYLDAGSRGQGEGSHNYVLFDDSLANITSYEQSQTRKELVAVHNLSARNLAHAHKMGGIAAPSMAVIKGKNPFHGFGEISLIAPKSMIDPRANSTSKVFGADVYSARYPQVSFKIKYSAAQALQRRLAPLARLANDERFQIDADRLERDPIRELEESPAVQAEFLIGRGIEPSYGDSKHVSQRQMQQQIGAAGLTDEFNDHVERVLASLDPVERIFKGFTERGARYIPHTIQNVLREMTRTIRDAEGFNYGVGSIRSKVTAQFRSIEALKKADSKIVSGEDFAKVKEEVNNEFVALANEAQTYNRQKGFGFMDTFSEHLKEIADGASPARVLKEYYDGAPPELGVRMADFLNKLRNMPTEYFEAKIKRSVGLNEFAGAVVPDDASPRTLKLLADNGITEIKRYKTGDAEDRARAVREFQDTEFFQEARGQISFAPDRATITLFQGRDLSTLLHESGHLWLEELGFDAKAANAPEQVKADYQAVLDWLGSTDGYITREQHETFARGFETYLMEGKAPSSELASAFRSFKNWLIQIYKRLTALGAPITPEIRQVFDRLIATDEQIATAQTAQGLNPIFTDAKAMGVSQAVFDAYTKQANAVADEAEQKLLQAKTEELRKQRTKEWRADEKLVREDVTNEVMSESGQQAFELLTKGAFPVGETPEVLKGIKISRETIVELYGDESVLALLPFGIWRDRASGPFDAAQGRPGTMSPDELAPLLGLDSGKDLVERLMQLEAQRRAMRAKGDTRSVAAARIAEETAQRMAERYGDPLNDGTIEAEAQKAIHSDRQAALMATEMAMLARNAGHSGTVSWADIKGWATDAIGGKAVRVATQPQQYLRNERQAGKRLEAALAKKDWVAALKAKQDQLVNLAMYQESTKAAAEVESAVKLMNRYAGAATLKGMDQDYLEQIHGLLEDYEFRRRTDKLLAERESFQAWAEKQREAGIEVTPPPRLAKGLGLTNYRDMTVDELRGLADTVKQIAHLGRTKRTLELDGKKRELDAVLTEMEQTAAKGVQRGKSLSVRGKSDIEISVGAAQHWLRVVNAELLKIERLLAFADGSKDGRGIFTRMIFRPIAAAETNTNDRRTELGKQQKAIYERVPAVQRKAWTRRHDLPELGTRLSKEEILAVALNMGNKQNLEKMLEGEKWTEEGVRAAVNRHLTREEWRFVEDVWKLIDSQWPEFAAMTRDTQGVAPPKVEAVPFMTPFGMVTGGYYPIAYDRRENLKAAKVGEKRDAALVVGMAPGANYGRPSTKAGSAHARTGFSAPIELSLSVIGKHLDEVSHDIFHRRAVMDIYKIISNDRFREALRSRLGQEYEKQFVPWLQRVASEAKVNNATLVGMDKAARALRVNVTTMAMGVRVSTMVQQVAGYASSIASIGSRYMLKGMAEWVRHPFDTAKSVRASSGAMRNRANNMERDLKAAADKYRGKSTWKASVARFAFRGIAMADAAVSIPTWVGGYHKGMAEGMSEQDAIYYADKVVRDTQGEGGAKDLSAFQSSGSETWKLMSMFYSFLNVFYNAQQQLIEDARTPGKGFSQWADLFWQASLWMVISPIAAALLAGQAPGDDEDPLWWGLRRIGFGAFSGIPVIRDLANTIERNMGGQPSGGFKLSPVEGPLEGSSRLINDLTKAFSGEDVSKSFIKNAFNVTGAFTGLPTGQPGVTAQFLWDALISGEQNPQNIQEWLRGLTYGPAK